LPGLLLAVQFFCPVCRTWKAAHGKHGSKCTDCHHQQQREAPYAAAAASAPSAQSSAPSLFGRPEGCLDQLTEVERAAIVTLHAVGWTGRAIAQTLKCSENTVTLWVQRWQKTRSLADAERSGRPRCTDDDTDQDIMLYADAHVNALPSDIVRELALPVDARTVRRRLVEIDLHTYVKRHEHAFTELDLKRRIAFAEGYSSWTENDWRRVLWSDHTLFTLDYQTRECVTRPPGMACEAKYLGQEERLEGAVWLWGCFCADGLGHAELYEGTLDARRYQSILALNLVKSAHPFWPRGQWWYPQDNASPHTAGTSRAWFHNHGIDRIDFPPWSSDLNPIELLWKDLKRRVYAHHPHTMEELEHFIVVEWQATDLNFCSRTCLNMPTRLQLVRANEGHKIKY
jgi:transposase